MLANSSTTQQAILTLNLAPTASELGWPTVHGIANASALHPNASAAVALAPATSTPGIAASWELTVPLREATPEMADMRTVVIVGTRETRRVGPYVYTPRFAPGHQPAQNLDSKDT